MTLISSFAVLLQELTIVMTAPSFQNFLMIATGWTFASHWTVIGKTSGFTPWWIRPMVAKTRSLNCRPTAT